MCNGNIARFSIDHILPIRLNVKWHITHDEFIAFVDQLLLTFPTNEYLPSLFIVPHIYIKPIGN